MQLSEFRRIVAMKNEAILNDTVTPESCEAAVIDTLNQASRLLGRGHPNPAALDPTFILTLIQLLLPVILEWINRRFPRPTPTVPPAEATHSGLHEE